MSAITGTGSASKFPRSISLYIIRSLCISFEISG
ncbi:hypothetical protein ALP99_200277 [Pseudomonas syringae pv. tomato]|nr:hypothetical protein ALP99_200277 [Pseudomonas syringae pv. tomato]